MEGAATRSLNPGTRGVYNIFRMVDWIAHYRLNVTINGAFLSHYQFAVVGRIRVVYRGVINVRWLM